MLILLHGFNVNDGATSSANVECCRGFMTKISVDVASMVKTQYWHGLGINEVLTWFHGKDECCHGFDMDEA